MKYYYREHIIGYQKVKDEGKTAWAEIHGYTGFENFTSRAFLEEILPQLHFSEPNPMVLECGCGTGPGACFLAERGFLVDGIDLIPLAIEMARELAKERNLNISYEVQDICELPFAGKKYDMIVDSFCLQGIVFKEDRERVFSVIHSRLKPEGYYLISTAMFDKKRFSKNKCILDTETGIIYNEYGENEIINMTTNIVFRGLNDEPDSYEDAVKIDNKWYLPVRRHWTADVLKAELETAGFSVNYQGGELGENVVAVVPYQ